MNKDKLQEYIDSKVEDGDVEYRLIATVNGSVVFDGLYESTDALMENGVRKAESATYKALEEDYQYELYEAQTNREDY